ncbi:MAG: MMPL family transporter, partial [Lentisphaeria bacterium]|nr:MMPL family transporter [Lentisphaeria bacterium]
MYKTDAAIFENNIRTGILLIVTAALVLAASSVLGYQLNNIPLGIGIGVVACIIVIPVQMMLTKAAILQITRGRPANPANPRERILLDRIATLSKNASLSKTPPLYITEAKAPNAFASGLGESSAFVCLTQGLMDTTDRDFAVTAVLSIAAIFILIACCFRSPTLPVILVLTIELAIWLNLSVPVLRGVTVSFVDPTCVNCIQLGATVDYAILLTTRFRE